MIKNIIFDLDGTLIDSSEDMRDCLYVAYNYIPKYKNIKIDSKPGKPLDQLIYEITPEISKENHIIVMKEFRKFYDVSYYLKTKLYPDVELILNTLKETTNLFIATNKPQYATEKILKNLNIYHLFTDIISLDSIRGFKMSKKEIIEYIIFKHELNSFETMMVGDDASDILAAKENKLKSYAVLYGYGNKDLINKSRPTYQNDDLHTLIYILNKQNTIYTSLTNK